MRQFRLSFIIFGRTRFYSAEPLRQISLLGTTTRRANRSKQLLAKPIANSYGDCQMDSTPRVCSIAQPFLLLVSDFFRVYSWSAQS